MQSGISIGSGGEDILMEMGCDVSAVRDFWRVLSSGHATPPSGVGVGRPRPRVRPFGSIKEVRLPCRVSEMRNTFIAT